MAFSCSVMTKGESPLCSVVIRKIDTVAEPTSGNDKHTGMQRVNGFTRPDSRMAASRTATTTVLFLLTAAFCTGFAQLTFDNLPADAVQACLTAPDATGITASGGCAPAVITVADGIATPGECDGTVLRTFTATDGCQTITGTQTITLRDDEAPAITIVQADLQGYSDGDVVYVECNSGFSMDVHSATASDNCTADPTLEFVESFGQAFDCLTTGQIASMNCGWRATDACGNVSTLMLTIVIRDTQAPQLLSTPIDTSAECGSVPAPAPVAVIDQCDNDIQVIFTEERTNLNCAGNYRLTRTWKATDDCGNTTVHVQLIDVSDTAPPVLSGVPADATISCTTPVAPPVVTAMDACAGSVAVSYAEVINGTVCDGATVARTWTATDACGNTATATQLITITDDEAPVIGGVPSDVTIGCDQPLPALPQVSVQDDCTALPQFSFVETTDVNGCERITTRSWTATDGCGNTVNASQRITQIDQTLPTLSPVASELLGRADNTTLEYECGSAPTFVQADVSASDDCTANAMAGLVISQLSNDACDRTTRYTWTVTDDCGNQASYTIFVRVRDTTPPVLSGVPADATHLCGGVPPAPTVTAVDNCSLAPVVFTESTSGSTCATRRLVRTWTATDDCGNAVSASQTITLADDVAPVLVGIPDDVDLGCGTVPAPANVTAFDNCDGTIAVAFAETTSGSSCADMQIVRTWTATDLCGNSTSGSRTILISDEEAPQFTQSPPTLNFSCDKTIPDPITPGVTDNCDSNPTVTFSETTQSGGCTHTYSLVRTWTATDDCGNQSTVSQTINLVDNEAPQFASIPTDITLECTDGLPDPNAVTVTDACDPAPSVEVTTAIVNGSSVCTGIQYQRTYVASDACGNTISAQQLITLADNTPPVLAFVHPDLVQYKNGDTIIFECNNFFDLEPTVTATDACDTDVDISFVDLPDPADDCVAAGYLVELFCQWTATDDCGNTATLEVIVRLRDTTAPVFDCPDDASIAPGQAVPAAVLPPVTDNCTDTPSTTFEEVRVDDPDGCGYTLTRTWTAFDECGNTATCSQVLTVQEVCDCPDIDVQQVTVDDAACEATDGSITVSMANPSAGYNFTWTPNLGTPNAAGNQRTDLPPGDYLIVITDPSIPNSDCEAKVNVIVGEMDCTQNGPCQWDYFGNDDTATVGLSDPDFCLPFNAVSDLEDILLNGAAYTPPPAPCAIDSLVYYTYALVVAQGSDGPYRVDSWTYPGGIWTGIVQDMNDLAAQMAQVDPGGNWENQPNSFIIDGPQTLNGYGQLIITHLATDVKTTIQRNYTGASFGTQHTFTEPGTFVWEVFDTEGCVDTLTVLVIDDIVPLQVDTQYVDVAYQTATQFCLDDTFLPGTPAAVLALEDPQSGFIDDGVPCPTYLPFDGFSGFDDALLALCDDTGVCDTTRVIFNVGTPLADPCTAPVFEQAFAEYELLDCGSTVTVCADIPQGQAANFAIYQNGVPYAGPITGCSFDTTYSYSYFLLPGNGENGPYQLNDWMVNGEVYSLTFANYTELIDQMNVWDPTGQWIDQQDGLSIEGGDPDKVYGPLRITHQPTGILSHLELNEGIDVIGVALEIGEGQHELVLLNTLNGCADTTQLVARCVPEEAALTITPVIRLEKSTPTDDDELDGRVAGLLGINGFSPNNDGVNDHFALLPADELGRHALTIYNRYGAPVYQSAAYANDWTGLQNGQPLPEGVYFFVLHRADGSTAHGSVVLQR